MTIGADLMP